MRSFGARPSLAKIFERPEASGSGGRQLTKQQLRILIIAMTRNSHYQSQYTLAAGRLPMKMEIMVKTFKIQNLKIDNPRNF